MFHKQNGSLQECENFFPPYILVHMCFRSITHTGQLMELQESVAQPNKAHLCNIFLQKYRIC